MATFIKPTDSGFARHTGESTVDKAKRTAEEVKDLAVDKARSEVESRANEGKERAASKLGGIASALRRGGDELGSDFASNYVSKAAQQIESLTDYVQSKELPEIVSDVERFARREPAIFLGGSFALGLLAARFLKSTSRRRDELELDEDDFESSFGVATQGAGLDRPMRPQVRDIARPAQAATGFGGISAAPSTPAAPATQAGSAGLTPGLGGMTNAAPPNAAPKEETPRRPDLGAAPTTQPATQASYGLNPTQTANIGSGNRTGGSGTGGGAS